MKIKIDKKTQKEMKFISFSELNAGDIFRYWSKGTCRYRYCLKIVSFEVDGMEFNYVDLEDGDCYKLNLTDTVEKYDDSLELKENSFKDVILSPYEDLYECNIKNISEAFKDEQ